MRAHYKPGQQGYRRGKGACAASLNRPCLLAQPSIDLMHLHGWQTFEAGIQCSIKVWAMGGTIRVRYATAMAYRPTEKASRGAVYSLELGPGFKYVQTYS